MSRGVLKRRRDGALSMKGSVVVGSSVRGSSMIVGVVMTSSSGGQPVDRALRATGASGACGGLNAESGGLSRRRGGGPRCGLVRVRCRSGDSWLVVVELGVAVVNSVELRAGRLHPCWGYDWSQAVCVRVLSNGCNPVDTPVTAAAPRCELRASGCVVVFSAGLLCGSLSRGATAPPLRGGVTVGRHRRARHGQVRWGDAVFDPRAA
jgi:hypothetical protein